MTRNKIFYFVILIVVLLILFNSFDNGETREEFLDRIATERANKDLLFKSDKESPFKDSLVFTELKYYPPDHGYVINAKFTKIVSPQLITLATSDGATKKYKEYGYAEFELEGQMNKLLLLEMEKPFQNKLFIPFADETSANQTYGAGRYLEADKPNGNIVALDFNLAYNPYCAYSEEYSCPFPPPENLLSVAIEAGEKKYYEN
jgi:uncharacterized protein (DUF1684 family)